MSKKVDMEKGISGFFSGVFVLSFSTVIVKLIGLVYKIPMLSFLGAEGMGYFNSACEIYALLCVIATAGLPTALSILISSYRASQRGALIKRIFKVAIVLFLVMGIIGSLILFIFAREISSFIENKNAYWCIVAISPTLLFVCISSAVRGYFQGFSNMYPTAISQLLEAVGKLVLGIFFAHYAISKGYSVPIVAAFAIMGLSLGVFISSTYLIIVKAIGTKEERQAVRVNKELYEEKNNKESLLKTLTKIALPITLSSAVVSVTRIIDMALIMRRLQDIGYTSGVSNEIYGAYTTVAVPIFNLIPSLLTPISLSLIPTLSGAIERHSGELQQKIVTDSLRLTVFFAMPSTLAIIIYSQPIISLLFYSVGHEISYVYPLLSLLGASVLFSCMITTTNAILQSYRKTVVPIVSMIIGATVKVVAAYILIGIPSVNVYGAPISTFLCDLIITYINLRCIDKSISLKSNVYSIYIKPLASSVVAVLLSFAVYIAISSISENMKIAFIVAIPVAVIIYFIISFCIRSITLDDVASLPMGDKIAEKIKSMNIKIKKENKNDEIGKDSSIGKEKL